MSGAALQFLSSPAYVKQRYACQITPLKYWEHMMEYGMLVRQIVVHTNQSMPSNVELYYTDINGKPQCIKIAVQSILKGWYLIDYQHINTCNREFKIISVPAASRAWAANIALNPEWRKELQVLPLNATVKFPPVNRTIAHITKLPKIIGMHILTDISWKGWKGPIKITAYGVSIFELMDEESVLAAEIMCKGQSTFHLGNCFHPWNLRNHELSDNIDGKTRTVKQITSAL